MAPRLFKNVKSPRIKGKTKWSHSTLGISQLTLNHIITTAWGPTLTGLSVVPALPYLYDHPVENATEWAFEWIAEKVRESPYANGKNSKKEL